MNSVTSIPPLIIVSPVPPPYHGASIATEILIQGLRNRGVEVHHINATYADNVGELSTFSWKKIQRMWDYRKQLLTLMQQYPDAAVLMTPAFYLGPFLKDALFLYTVTRARKKAFLWFHMNFLSFNFPEKPAVIQQFILRTLLKATYFITVGDSLRKWFPPALLKHPTVAIHNGVNLEFSNSKKSDSSVNVLYFSNIGKTKGWLDLFRIAEEILKKKISENGTEIAFSFYGGCMADSPEAEVKSTFASSKYANKLYFGGKAYGKDKDAAFTSSDIFCFPSKYPPEAFPLVILEAMAAGLPIVATDVGAVQEAVVDGKGGFLVPSGNLTLLQEKLELLIHNKELRQEMGEFNRKRYQELFTSEKFIDRWIEFLSTVH